MEIIKVGIIGSRSFVNWMDGYKRINPYYNKYKFTHIISGGAKGADKIAKMYANDYGFKYIEYPADWKKHGKEAGFIRNFDIVNNSDFIIAFWNGKSRGTQHSINLAGELGKEVYIERF